MLIHHGSENSNQASNSHTIACNKNDFLYFKQTKIRGPVKCMSYCVDVNPFLYSQNLRVSSRYILVSGPLSCQQPHELITCLFRKTQVSSCRRKTSIISEINLTLYSSYITKSGYPTCELLEKIIGLKTIRCIINLWPIYNELNIRSKNNLDINWPSLKDLKVKWDAQTNLHRLTRVYIEGRHSIKTHFRKGSMEEKRLKIGFRFLRGNILKVK